MSEYLGPVVIVVVLLALNFGWVPIAVFTMQRDRRACGAAPLRRPLRVAYWSISAAASRKRAARQEAALARLMERETSERVERETSERGTAAS